MRSEPFFFFFLINYMLDFFFPHSLSLQRVLAVMFRRVG